MPCARARSAPGTARRAKTGAIGKTGLKRASANIDGKPIRRSRDFPLASVAIGSAEMADAGGQQIAVTGAAGRIGSAVARRLAALGHALVLIDRQPLVDAPAGAEVVTIDGRDVDALTAATRGVDAICHLGERAGVPRDAADPGETREHNIAACRAVIAAAVANGIGRIVYASSFQRYGLWGGHHSSRPDAGFTPRRLPFDESEPANPQNAYAESKVANEAQLKAFPANGAGRSAIALRLPLVMPLPGSDDALFDRVWRTADTDRHRGVGTYLDVRDAAEAFALAIRPDRPLAAMEGGFVAIHLAADDVAGELTTRQKIAALSLNWPALPNDWPAWAPPVSCERARRLLGWRPSVRLERPAGISVTNEARRNISG